MPRPDQPASIFLRQFWGFATGAALLIAVMVSIYSLSNGIENVFPHLFYLPIILAGYAYPRKGLLFSIVAGGIYLGLVYYFQYPVVEAIAAGTARFYVMILIGAVVSYLSDRCQQEEQKYRGIFNFSEAGTFLFNPKNDVLLDVNARGARMLAVPDRDLRGMSFTDFWKRQDTADLFLKQLNQNRSIENLEVELVRRDGAPLWVLLSGSNLPGEMVICTAVDITARKAAEEQVHRNENLYRAIFENTGTATMILRDDWSISLVNTQFERITGYSREEIEGRVKWTEFAQGWVFGACTEIPAEGQRTCEFKFRDHQGRTRDGTATVLHIPGTTEYVASFSDITESRTAEAMLRASEEKLRVVFNNTNDGIVVNKFDTTGFPSRFIEVNNTACERLGIPREEFLQMTPADLGLFSFLQDRPDLLTALRARQPVTFEVTLTAKNGVRIPTEISSHIVTLHGEDVILSVARDITERKLTEEVERKAYDQLERNIQQFATLGDHIRNPLGIIVGIADLEETAASTKILQQARVIDKLITKLDTGWIESDLVKGYLQRQRQKEGGNGK
ncbi:MAG: PAS domain-containing protein [Methanomicrobiales archaeon]|nr:PAS domain-containing protein [Methanomicrobiales archaeon]